MVWIRCDPDLEVNPLVNGGRRGTNNFTYVRTAPSNSIENSSNMAFTFSTGLPNQPDT